MHRGTQIRSHGVTANVVADIDMNKHASNEIFANPTDDTCSHCCSRVIETTQKVNNHFISYSLSRCFFDRAHPFYSQGRIFMQRQTDAAVSLECDVSFATQHNQIRVPWQYPRHHSRSVVI